PLTLLSTLFPYTTLFRSHLVVLAEYPAVALFLDRMRHALPSFRPTRHNMRAIAQICRRLDGIPLAIELAAAQTRGLTPGQIAERDRKSTCLNSSHQIISY